MSRAIDAHAHVIVREITRNGHPAEDWRPRVRREGGRTVVELGGREIRSMVDEMVDIETLLATQLARGVDGVVLCPFVPLLFADAEPDACLERCRIQNGALGSLVAADPGRISALGAVPLQDPELAAEELLALRAEGILAGVEITASVRGAYVGDSRFEPFWEAASRSGMLVFIHPTTRAFEQPVFVRQYLWNTVGNPLETTIAAAQMTMSGLLERRPNLRVLLAHGGGALLAIRGRLEHAHGFQPDARAELLESPLGLYPAVLLRHRHPRPRATALADRMGRCRPGPARLRLPVRHGRSGPRRQRAGARAGVGGGADGVGREREPG